MLKSHRPLIIYWSSHQKVCQNLIPKRYVFLSSALHIANKDFYKILGVERKASSKDIKMAYFALAKQYHPDANRGNKEALNKFQEISQAYEVLGNKEKRQHYDMLGFQQSSGPFRSGAYDKDSEHADTPFGSSQQWSYRKMNEKDSEEMFHNILRDLSSSTTGKNSMFGSVILKMFSGVGSKLLQEMIKQQNSSNSKFFVNFDEYEIKQGPNGIEFIPKNRKKK